MWLSRRLEGCASVGEFGPLGMLRQLIKQERMRSLSSDEIEDLVDHKCRVMEYSELANVRDISDVCTPDRPLVLLYETRQNYGHWTCLIDHGDYYEVFDPYGVEPDSQLHWVSHAAAVRLGQSKQYLSRLLADRAVTYNNVALQGKKTSTCGRWVAVRILLKHWPVGKFAVLFATAEMRPDDLVTLLTLLPLLRPSA